MESGPGNAILKETARQHRLAIFYDAHHGHHLKDLDFWIAIAKQQGGTILELGCGTGRVLIPLARAGFTILGLDRSAAMLGVLKQKIEADEMSPVDLIQSDLTAYWLAARYFLITLPCNTFSTLTEVERMACLAKAYQHLDSGGLFVTSMPNPAMLATLRALSDPEVEEVFLDPESGDPVQVSSGWKREADHFRIFWHYDQLFSSGQVQRTSIETVHHINDPETYLEELRAAGLGPVGVYGDFDFSTYTEHSPHLILTAQR